MRVNSAITLDMSFQTPVYPGINLNADQGPQLNAVGIAFIVLSFVTLVLRLISRLRTKVPIEADDWLIVAAAVGFLRRK